MDDIRKKIKYSIEWNGIDEYRIHIDCSNDQEFLDKNIYKIANAFCIGFKLTEKWHKIDIVNDYLIIIRY